MRLGHPSRLATDASTISLTLSLSLSVLHISTSLCQSLVRFVWFTCGCFGSCWRPRRARRALNIFWPLALLRTFVLSRLLSDFSLLCLVAVRENVFIGRLIGWPSIGNLGDPARCMHGCAERSRGAMYPVVRIGLSPTFFVARLPPPAVSFISSCTIPFPSRFPRDA